MKIIRTKTPETLAGKIVSHASGNNPYTLVSVPDEQVLELKLEADVIDDTVAFLGQYDLNPDKDLGEEI